MTALERKRKTEEFLKSIDIPFIDHLPTIEEESEIKIRAPREIASRIMILIYLNFGSETNSRDKVSKFLKEENLWTEVSDTEKQLLIKPGLTDQEKTDIFWKSEAVWLLLWTIGKVDVLELPRKEIDVRKIIERVPKLWGPTKDFINTASVISTSEILDMSDLIYRLHWATRQFQLSGKTKLNLHPSIVLERHYAINWTTNYSDNWDDVATDT
jgi:Domain of unknown function (DUF4272)